MHMEDYLFLIGILALIAIAYVTHEKDDRSKLKELKPTNQRELIVMSIQLLEEAYDQKAYSTEPADLNNCYLLRRQIMYLGDLLVKYDDNVKKANYLMTEYPPTPNKVMDPESLDNCLTMPEPKPDKDPIYPGTANGYRTTINKYNYPHPNTQSNPKLNTNE